MDSQTRKWKGNPLTKKSLPTEKQPLDELCDGAMEFKHSVALDYPSELLPSYSTGSNSAKCWVLPSSSCLKSCKGTSQSPGQASSSQGASKSVMSDLGLEEMEVDVRDGQTSIRQYRLWHPDESISLESVVGEHFLSSLEDMAANYRLPYKRVRGRDDGVGGAVMFQPTEKVPPEIEDAIARAFDHPKDLNVECEFHDRERWDLTLEGDYRKAWLCEKKKRRLCVATSSCETEEKVTTKSLVGRQHFQEGGIRKSRKEDERPDPHVDLELDYVKTGGDCVSFLMENEGKNRVKTFYCTSAETGKKFQPYDLVVVPKAKANKEYFSWSYDGIVHCDHSVGTCTTAGNHKISTFTPLEEWMRHKFVFTLMHKVHFFGNYVRQKCFNIWRKHIGHSHFTRVRKELEQKLFFAKPAFLAALCQIYAHVNQLCELEMLSVKSNHLYNLEDFIHLQNETRQKILAPAVEAISDKVQEILAKICLEAKSQAQIYRGSVRDEAELNDIIGVNLHQTRGSKVQSMLSIKREKVQCARTYHRVVAEEKMLGNLIRLVDYMFVEGLTHRAIMTTMEILSILDHCRYAVDKSSKGVFLTTVSFGETTITFTPGEATILHALNNALDSVLTALQSAPRVSHMRVFLPFLDAKFIGMNPISIIKMTPYFSHLRAAIDHIIVSNFAEARKYAQIFEEHRDLFAFGESWDFELYASEKHTVRQYREELARQREWRIELEKMRTSNTLGILHIDSRSLRNTLIPITSKTLELLKGLLMSNSKKDALAALIAFQERAKELDMRPVFLDDFVKFMKVVLALIDDLFATCAIFNESAIYPSHMPFPFNEFALAAKTLLNNHCH